MFVRKQPLQDQSFEINLNYNVERKRSFRGHEEEDCNDSLQIYIDDQLDTAVDSSPDSLMVDNGRFCGQGNKVVKINSSAKSVTILLVSDKGGKYKQLEDWDRYMNDARRTVLRFFSQDWILTYITFSAAVHLIAKVNLPVIVIPIVVILKPNLNCSLLWYQDPDHLSHQLHSLVGQNGKVWISLVAQKLVVYIFLAVNMN